MYGNTKLIIFCIPAVPKIETRSRAKLMSVWVGRKEVSVKIRTHNSKEPMSSSTEVKILSNPTRRTADHKI